ncbi:hypothetical protein ABDD95_19445 [Mucilaginibacter sp. PAMB04274]|uniref:hypothetical protein n=1 Tax=Mucilaginibacter sp. PAMB04274 TaxID=3138568 RepID=UPI0031F65F2A
MRYTDRLRLLENEVLESAHGPLTTYEQDSTIAHIIAERAQIAEDIHRMVFELSGDQPRAEMLISDIQNEIALFSDKHFRSLNRSSEGASVNNYTPAGSIVEALLAEMDTLYATLQENYPRLFNMELPIPLSLRNRRSSAIAQQAETVLMALNKQEVDASLVSLIAEYLHTFFRYSDVFLSSSREIDYYTFVVGHLYRFVKSSFTADFKEKLFRELIYMNFNSLPLINYYLKEIQLNYDQIESYQSELYRLIIDQRNLKSLPVHPKFIYQPGGISLKELLSGAIAEEISCVEQLQRIQEKKMYKDWPSGVISPFYFHVSLTLEQLTFLFRIMIEAGVVIVKKKLELFDFIAKHIGTTNKDNLATRSIKNKFGSPSALTIQKVKHMLLMLVNLINERYPA